MCVESWGVLGVFEELARVVGLGWVGERHKGRAGQLPLLPAVRARPTTKRSTERALGCGAGPPVVQDPVPRVPKTTGGYKRCGERVMVNCR